MSDHAVMSGDSNAAGPVGLTTGLPGLDKVLRGLCPGDNVVWGVDSIDDYRRLVIPYEEAARLGGRHVVYFRFAEHEPLFPRKHGLDMHRIDPYLGFERFVRAVHRVIEQTGPGAVYIFDSISALGDAWFSDSELGNFFVLTCPRLRELQTFTYFALERDGHSLHAVEPIRHTTQFYLDVFTQDGQFYIRPVKVQYRSQDVMNTLHVEKDGAFVPVEESTTLASILSTTRWPRLWRNRRAGYWDRMYQQLDRVLEKKGLGICTAEMEESMLNQLQTAFRIHRSGIASLAKRWLKLEDYQAIRQRMIGIGSIGGKALGMLVARAILRENAPELSAKLEVHDSFFVGAGVFVSYLVQNDVWWIREAQQAEKSFLKDLEEGRRRILEGTFPKDVLVQLEGMLDYFGERPCIVRSSSILEDARGNAFSGKYESVFLANVGSREERMAALLDAIRRVYASVLDPEAILYRKSRGLLASEERMALLIMRVSGRLRGKYFFPQAAGVGLSYNPWCWHETIEPEDGVTRLVFGLGTRAVDRVDDDYTRLVSLSAPLRRPEASLDEEYDHSQRRMDVIDLEKRALVSVPVEELVDVCKDFPLRYYIDRERDGMPWVTFSGLLKNTRAVEDLKEMLRVLSNAYRASVDIEFTLNFLDDNDSAYTIHLLQCRTFQVQKHRSLEVRHTSQMGRCVLETRGAVIGLGREIPIHDLLYVPTAMYAALSERERYAVARLIETLTQAHDPRRNLVLVGPGRWGTSSPSLGVPVSAGRIARACAVCEVVAMHSGLVPDVSLGTHFFNDLVEHDLLYLACFPHKPGNFLDEDWLMAAPSLTVEKLTTEHAQSGLVRWLDMSNENAVLVADPVSQSARIFLPDKAEEEDGPAA